MDRREEYVRNLNHNYYRVELEEFPEEKKYQYCILSRGGIQHLLPCEIRYINGTAYLYYEITSLQNLTQCFAQSSITRQWFASFLEGMKCLSGELYRFLLEEECIHWGPQHIFQDYEQKEFYYLFLPYENHYDTYRELLDFMVERICYEDEAFVEFFYRMYDRFQKIGRDYLTEQIFTDFEAFEKGEREQQEVTGKNEARDHEQPEEIPYRNSTHSLSREQRSDVDDREMRSREMRDSREENPVKKEPEGKGWLSFLNGRKTKEEKVSYRQKMKELMEQYEDIPGHVAEHAESYRQQTSPYEGQEDGKRMIAEPETEDWQKRGGNKGTEDWQNRRGNKETEDWRNRRGNKETEDWQNRGGNTETTSVVSGMPEDEMYGKTVYIDNVFDDSVRGLYRENGELLATLTDFPFVIGKKRDQVNLCFQDQSVSRVHAQIVLENHVYYISDTNSLNGTYKNGLKLNPYEKRKLEKEDELRFGTMKCIFR